VLRHLPELLRVRADVRRRVLALRPDVFVGIDAPDFNLKLERQFKEAGIPTVHYVSPSVWAWRESRAAKLGRSADLVLCLFPMEPPIYARYGVDARFVGHPLADRFARVTDRAAARDALGLRHDAPVLAVMPGSRLGEIRRLGADFLDAARRCQAEMPGLQIVAPMATPACRAEFEAQAAQLGIDVGTATTGTPTNDATGTPTNDDGAPFRARVQLLDGEAHNALLAADVVLLASGTAALEAMLAKRPMVVAYKVSPWTYRIVTWFKLMRTTRYSLPNVLADRELVPEILQDACTPPALARAVLGLLRDTAARVALVGEFERLHDELRGGGDRGAADAVDELIRRRRGGDAAGAPR
jgi:lipid-A-disaccharide synthase